MSSPVFTCTVEANPCPPEAQQPLDFVGFSVGPDCGAIFVLIFGATLGLNMLAWKLSRVMALVR